MNPFLEIDRQIVGDVYTSDESMDNLIVLCDEFGSRFGGTVGERRAAEFMSAKMVEYGLSDVRCEPVEYVGWTRGGPRTRGEARLEVIVPGEAGAPGDDERAQGPMLLPCISLPHSPPADLEAEIVDLGDGAPADFDARAGEIEGRIVMTTSVVHPKGETRWIHRGEKYGRALMAGAAGFLFVNHYPGYGPATGGVGHDGEGLIPGLSIGKEDGALIQRTMRRKGAVRARIHTTDRCAPMTSWNVIGDLPGREHPEQVVMIGCHYDGHDISQGAEDPISGGVAVLEAARVLAAYAPGLPRTVRFVLWGVEEIGLIGSRAYAAAHAAELPNLRFYLNMDSAGTRATRRDIALNEWPELEPLFERWADEMALDVQFSQSVSAHSDHFPFFMAGVPTGGMQPVSESAADRGADKNGRGYGHTRYDTVDKVERKGLREAAALAARLALRIASADEWPAAMRSEEAVRALLDTPEYREERAFHARLDEFYARARG